MKRGTAIALAVGLGLALFAGGAAASVPGGKPVSAKGLKQARAFAALAGLSSDWQDVRMFVAYGESKGNNFAGLGHTSGAPPHMDLNLGEAEAVAAKRAYDRNAEQYGGCWPEAVYTFGSGGWDGMLPANGLDVFAGTEYVCLHPWTVMDPAIETVMWIGFVRRLYGWDGFQVEPTVLNLRVGIGDPSSMGDPAVLAAKRPKYEKQLREIGLPVSLLDRRLPRPPLGDPVALARKLGANLEAWMPGGSNA